MSQIAQYSKSQFFSMVAVTAIAGACSVWMESILYFIFPLAILGFSFFVQDYRRLFYAIFAVLPFSMEYYFYGAGIGTDLPSEPLMILLCGIGIILLIRNSFSFEKVYVFHPIFILIFIHLFWIFITTINSQDILISTKFLLAKIWYLVPFFYLPLIFFKDKKDFTLAYDILYKFLFIAICIVLIRHAMEGFSFISSYDVVRPFFRNHVSYAAISVICLPFVWAFFKQKASPSLEKKVLGFILVIFLIGIYFSYTRAAILSIFIAIGAYYIIKYRWVKQALAVSSFVAILVISLLVVDNKYLDFAPEYERTISHTEFDNLLEATYKLEDISSMERVYRWMAGVEMIKDKPFLGFGPGSFFSYYKSYSINRFETYVSDNPEQSGIHNYFLMIFVEQGFIGFIIFIFLCFALIIETENTYHRLSNRQDKYIVMAIGLSFIIIFAMSLINDLIETDKVGPFFFLNAAALLYYRKRSLEF